MYFGDASILNNDGLFWNISIGTSSVLSRVVIVDTNDGVDWSRALLRVVIEWRVGDDDDTGMKQEKNEFLKKDSFISNV